VEIDKSTRHSKIIGEFGEAFLCNWLSRSGFEVAIVDHTGLDVIAYHPKTNRRLGITVKSRTRDTGKETDSVTVFSNNKQPGDREKLLEACTAFACEPWIAVYVETAKAADLYLMSLEQFETDCKKKSCAIGAWKMSKKHKLGYETNKDVQHICVEFKVPNWEFGSSEDKLPANPA
jgi:hypothetical protein